MRPLLPAFLALLLAGSGAADAVLLDGKGDGRTECWIGLDVEGAKPVAASSGRGRQVRIEQQACAGACDFSAQVCLNNAGCPPAVLTDVHVLGKAQLDRPKAATPEHVCGKPRTLTLPLRAGGRRSKRKLVLLARTDESPARRDTDTITLVCTPAPVGDRCARCGDGDVGDGELCDDGNARDGDGCDRNCTPTACNNAVRTAGEQCDDGNVADGDGCDSNCTRTGCGNGVVSADEECDPPGPLTEGIVCNASCREEEVGPCTCPAPEPTRLIVGSIDPLGSCGVARATTGQVFRDLACGGLYIGGGDGTVEQPIPVPAGTEVAFGVTCSGRRLTLGQTTPGTAGAPNRCTATGCRFGPPLAAPNTLSESLSTCIVSTVSRAAAGEASCDTGSAQVLVPLTAEVYLTGEDQAPAEPGLQACPVCLQGQCRGGANPGAPCTPYAAGVSTSYDCMPAGPPLDEVSLELALSTETISWNAVPSGTQARVFCGYCRDADVTLAFANPPVACLQGGRSGALCAAPYESCEQRQQGAFGPNGGGVSTITLVGAPGGALVVGTPVDATLASVFCIPPVAGDVVNNNVSLPGPAVLTLPVRMTLEGS